jgi:capsular polysaccharide transport system permease protein
MPNDVVLAKALVESSTMLIVAVIVFGILAWLELPWRPHDPLGLLGGMFATVLLGTGIGAVSALIALFIRSWDRASRLILRPFFLVSGVMFLTDSMPETFRNIIVWNPLLHCIEWIRESFYRGYVCQSLDRFYPIFVGMGCLCFALAMERLFRRRIYEMVRS